MCYPSCAAKRRASVLKKKFKEFDGFAVVFRCAILSASLPPFTITMEPDLDSDLFC